MGDTYSLCLLGIMDRLWFHQIILFSEPMNTALYATKILNQHQPTSDSSTLRLLPLQDTQTHHQSTMKQENPFLKPSSPITSLESSTKNEEDIKERPTRKDISVRTRARSHSSSPMTQKRTRKHWKQVKSLQKSSSCRSFEDLEMEEVKGFMDLGFVFKKSNLSPKLMSVVPGLQRLVIYNENEQSPCDGTIVNNLLSSSSTSSSSNDGEEEEGETKTSVNIMRPYLSEAWLIKRPDSPLLNLRVPKVSAPADMKKHLKFWARTVASEIQYESWDERRFG